MDRILLVGINAYPGSPLRGCINDIDDMASVLSGRYGISKSAIHTLKDASATKSAVVSELEWLVDGSGAGNRILFHYSGHGTQLPDTANRSITDTICPVDFDFTAEHAVSAKDFARIFSAIPDGTEFNWLSDSCFSGDLTRFWLRDGSISRYLDPPSEIYAEISQILNASEPRLFRFETSTPLNGGFISGCGAQETSADADFGGRFNGAFTYFFLKQLASSPSASLTNLRAAVLVALRKAGYSQTPVVKGAAEITSQPFLGGVSIANRDEVAQRALMFTSKEMGNIMTKSDKKDRININLDGAKISIELHNISVENEIDIENLMKALSPLVAKHMLAARTHGKRDWSVSGTVSTSSGGTTGSVTGTVSGKDYNVSVSGSTTVGGATVTATASTGTQGQSGSITIGGTF